MNLRLNIFLFLNIAIAKGFAQTGYIPGKPALAFWEVGTNSEIVIVLHGGPGAEHSYLQPEWDTLAQVAKVIYYDQRGNGLSEKSNCYSWTEHVNDLKRVINFVAQGKRVFLAGSSWGSTLALLYSLHYPSDVKGIILSGTYKWNGKGKPLKACSLYEKGDFEVTDDSARMVKFYHKTFSSNSKNFALTMNSMESAPTLGKLRKIQIPTVLFKGLGDCHIKEGADQFVGILKNLDLRIIRNACHDPWYSHKKEVFKIAIDFIRKIK